MTTIIIKEQRLDIYPNPASEEINISGLNGEVYNIYTLDGELIEKELQGSTIRLGNIQSGIYFILTETGRSSRFSVIR